MTVVINELEVIAPPEPQREPRIATPSPADRPQPGPTPADIHRALRQLALRRLRVSAD